MLWNRNGGTKNNNRNQYMQGVDKRGVYDK